MNELHSAQTLELIEPTNLALNTPAKLVAPNQVFTPYVQAVIDRMLELSAGKGYSKHDSRQMVGLAAVQLGVALQIITIDVTADGSLKDQNLEVFINPRITYLSDVVVDGREGCWSCGNICGNVQRSKNVTISAFDRSGKHVSVELTDFPARIAQHEIDHLNGIRFPDRIPLDQPERLHKVEPSEFPAYRVEWQNWANLTKRETWEAMKSGVLAA